MEALYLLILLVALKEHGTPPPPTALPPSLPLPTSPRVLYSNFRGVERKASDLSVWVSLECVAQTATKLHRCMSYRITRRDMQTHSHNRCNSFIHFCTHFDCR